MIKLERTYLTEVVVPGKPLGRHVNHDSRSKAYRVRPFIGEWKTKRWIRQIPVLDQGSLGSCTGNAATGLIGTEPLFSTSAIRGLTLDQQFAIGVYSDATRLDPYQGEYPPEDTGSDGLSVAKVLQKRGLISGYVHCLSLDDVINALQTSAVITGVNWYESMDSPDSSGLVRVTGSVRGGHEFEVIGVDLEAQLIWFVNSWGANWGTQGMFCMSFDDYARLLSEQGDATQFIGVDEPAPTPAPGADPDADLIKAMDPWARTIISRFTKAGKAKAAYEIWKKARV